MASKKKISVKAHPKKNHGENACVAVEEIIMVGDHAQFDGGPEFTLTKKVFQYDANDAVQGIDLYFD
ncbi:hypothetical protein HX823_09725 [Pseudomonas sp. P7759]|uniref:hypothetical protein n=1 Tax=Pseudomonas sp. P7759 TaxID=2738831 RepID=UPI00105484BE|nr:hypothetical protein [Pseudomonas sp. P7759]NWC74356.1 hypothetical protein [Pseudomonas sp. P7759]